MADLTREEARLWLLTEWHGIWLPGRGRRIRRAAAINALTADRTEQLPLVEEILQRVSDHMDAQEPERPAERREAPKRPPTPPEPEKPVKEAPASPDGPSAERRRKQKQRQEKKPKAKAKAKG